MLLYTYIIQLQKLFQFEVWIATCLKRQYREDVRFFFDTEFWIHFYYWRKRSMSTHSERSNPPTFELKIGLKLA